MNRWPQQTPSDLPVGWSRKPYGTTGYSSSLIKGTWKFEGPESLKEEAYKIVEKYYDGFGVEITWETDSS